MCTKRSYTPYQRQAIKGIAKIIGQTPFRYEKAANNHLKVMIDGIDQVFFSSSTPSDHRALDNFLSEIRCAYRQHTRVEDETPKSPPKSVRKAKARKSAVELMDKVSQQSLKVLRNSLEMIKQEEKTMVEAADHNNLNENIRSFRQKKIRAEIDRALDSFGEEVFVPPGQIRRAAKSLEENLSFMLPDSAEYSRLLARKSGMLSDIPRYEANIQDCLPEEETDKISALPKMDSKAAKPSKKKRTEASKVVEKKPREAQTKEDAPVTKAQHEVESRTPDTQQLRNEIQALSKQEILALISDCESMVEQKHQEDIRFLVEQMQARNVQLDELRTAMEVSV